MKKLFFLLFVFPFLFSCGDDSSDDAIVSKQIDKSQKKLNALLDLLTVRMKKENCRSKPLIIENPYTENMDKSVYGRISFGGANLELEYSFQFFKNLDSYLIGRDTWRKENGKLSDINISTMNANGMIIPVLNAQWRSSTQSAKFKAFPVFNGDKKGTIYYEIGNDGMWVVWGYSKISNDRFENMVDLMCQLAEIKDPRNIKNVSKTTEKEVIVDSPDSRIENEIEIDNEAITNCYDDLLKSQQEGFFWVEQLETTYSAFIDTYFMKIYYVCDGDYYEAINADDPDAYAQENGWMAYTGILIPNPSMNGPNVYVIDGVPVGEIEFYQKTDFDRNQFQGY